MARSFVGDGNSDHLLQMLKERSDDFNEAVLIPPGWRVADQGVPVSPVLQKIILLLVKADGGYHAVAADQDIENILNDGILNRMRIPIRCARPTGEPLVPASLIPPS